MLGILNSSLIAFYAHLCLSLAMQRHFLVAALLPQRNSKAAANLLRRHGAQCRDHQALPDAHLGLCADALDVEWSRSISAVDSVSPTSRARTIPSRIRRGG
jgi:hypothetical protein